MSRLDIEDMGDTAERRASVSDLEQTDGSGSSIWRCAEGHILLVGIVMAAAFVLWVIVALPVSGEKGSVLGGMAVTEIIFGRAATMALGYSLGLSDAMVIVMSIILETILVLLFYPLFVFSWRHLLVLGRLENSFERMRRAAERHKDKVQRYGMMGLFVFVWLPFWMTGPAVGCVLGFLLGLRAWVNMAVVLGGTYVAIFGWAYFLRKFHERAASYNTYAGVVVIMFLVIVIAVGHFLQGRRRGNKSGD